MHELIDSGGAFDPSQSNRDLIIAGADITLGPQMSLMKRFRSLAPNLQIKFDAMNSSIDHLISGKTDLLIALYPPESPSSVTSIALPTLHWGVLAAGSHPISNNPSLDEWLSYSHVQVSTGTQTRSPVTDALNQLDKRRKIGLRVSFFLQALHAVAVSDMLFTTLVTLTDDISDQLSLRQISLPLDIPDVPSGIFVRNTPHDQFSRWLCDNLRHCSGHQGLS